MPLTTEQRLLLLHQQAKTLSLGLNELWEETQDPVAEQLYDMEELAITIQQGISRALILNQLSENKNAPDTA